VPSLVYIHGRGLKPPPEIERKAWLDALNRGLARLSPPAHQLADDDRFRLAYWSDVFYPPGATEEQAGLTDAQTAAIFALIGKFWQWRLPQPAAPIVDEKTKQFEDNFVRDVIKFFGLGYEDKCAERLRAALLAVPTGDPVMLVSHSFGTVLAYDVLINALPTMGVTIDTWVTMGTPLSWVVDLQAKVPDWNEQLLTEVDQGLQPVLATARNALDSIGNVIRGRFGNLFGQPGIAAAAPTVYHVPQKQFPPAGVNRWFNIYDPRDPVACAGGFSALLGGLAIGSTFLYNDQQRAFDVAIRNDACPAAVATSDMRAHEDFIGYGQCGQLAQLVVDFWQRSGGMWT
jgi:hypothetical protein